MLRIIISLIMFVMVSVVPAQAADVYIQRGLFGFLFQSGVYTMAKDLEKQGHNVFFTCWQTPCQKQIIKKIQSRPGKKFAMIGHSMGGNAVTEMSADLKKLGIRIPYMAVFDAPVPSIVSSNVDKVDNFYQFHDWRNPILKVESKKTIIRQFDQVGKYNHIEIAEALENRKRVYQQVNKLGK